MDGNKIKIILILLLLPIFSFGKDPHVFTFYIKNEHVSLDPVKVISGEINYLHATLYRGLTRYTDEGTLIFDDAERCRFIIDTEVRCKLRKDLKYSDGSPITSKDYLKAFEKIMAPDGPSYLTPLLTTVKSMKAMDDREIQFLLKESDREFLEKLSNPLLIPFKNETAFNGPYKISKIEKGKRWILEPNTYFTRGNPKRPAIELLFVPEDSTAVDLYEKGQLDFLWRLPTPELQTSLKNRADFVEINLSRFDYIGFNQREGKPLHDKKLREMLSHSLDFEQFETMFFSHGAAGCPGLGDRFLQSNPKRCLKHKNYSEKVIWPQLQLKFSQLGGIDVERQVVWLKEQWKKYLGINIDLKSMEQKSFITELKQSPPDIFRKGINLNRPSCLAALEYFKSDHPENFTGFKDTKFDEMIKPLQTRRLSRTEKDSICAAASDYLFNEKAVGIPLGRIYYSMLINPSFKGVKINELNQLDLSELEYVGKK